MYYLTNATKWSECQTFCKINKIDLQIEYDELCYKISITANNQQVELSDNDPIELINFLHALLCEFYSKPRRSPRAFSIFASNPMQLPQNGPLEKEIASWKNFLKQNLYRPTSLNNNQSPFPQRSPSPMAVHSN